MSRSKRKTGRPRKAAEVRQVYSVRLPPSLADEARKQISSGALTDAVETALVLWLAQPS